MALRGSLAAALAAAVLAAIVTAVPAVGLSALTVSGTELLHPPPHPEDLLPGYFADSTVSRIDYPAAIFGMDASLAVATAGIGTAVNDTLGPLIVAGFSQGAIAVAYAKQALMSLPDDQRPGPERLTFLTIGDPSGPAGILNALLGAVYVHGRYETVPGGLDLSAVPAANVSTSTNSLGGTTTSYLIPTVGLPLVQPLRDIGIPEPIVAAIEGPLKDMVDAGYARHDAAAGVRTPRAVAGIRAEPRPARVVRQPVSKPAAIGNAAQRRSQSRSSAVA